MNSVNLEDVAMVARRLKPLGKHFVFTGGSIVALLLDRPAVTKPRHTKDVDVIVEVASHLQYTDLEKPLRAAGFKHDTSEDAPICRWIVDGITVDVMPMNDPGGSFKTRWFDLAVATAVPMQVHGETILVITAPCFIATKMEAFKDRGDNDFMVSHDIEDFLTVVDGRDRLLDEIQNAPKELRSFIAQAVAGFLAGGRFLDSLPGHFPDKVSQRRQPALLVKLNAIAALSAQK
jgi:predicted nucleotidyltransferase